MIGKAGAHPESPCTGDCVIDTDSGLCEGCYRDLEEIMDWPVMSALEKQRVLNEVESRRSALEGRDGN